MSEYLHVEKPFLDQLATLGWTVIDQGQGFIPSDPSLSLRRNFREWLLPEVFRDAIRSIDTSADGSLWLTDRQLDDLRDQILRQPNRTLLEANEAIHSRIPAGRKPICIHPRQTIGREYTQIHADGKKRIWCIINLLENAHGQRPDQFAS